MSSGLINFASIDREACCAARDAPALVADEELFFHGKRVGPQT